MLFKITSLFKIQDKVYQESGRRQAEGVHKRREHRQAEGVHKRREQIDKKRISSPEIVYSEIHYPVS